MNQIGFPILSIIIFLPLVGALIALALGKNRKAVRIWALVVALVDLALACVLWSAFDYGQAGMQFVDRFPWIESLGISYYVGVDGISLWMLLLTALLSPVAVFVSWKFLDSRPEADAGAFLFFVLMLQTGILGVFAALDLILFHIFWEAMLVPAYFLIGRWGGEPSVALHADARV